MITGERERQKKNINDRHCAMNKEEDFSFATNYFLLCYMDHMKYLYGAGMP